MSDSCEVQTKPKTFNEMLGSTWFWTPALAVIKGGILGYLYYHFIGCVDGACAITSDPFLSILSGAFIGFLYVNRPCRTC
jgi:hypothetical protein